MMQNLEVKVSRQWDKRTIETVIRCTDKEIAIHMPLNEFVTALGELAAAKLPIVATRTQVKIRLDEALTVLIGQMKESARSAVSPVVKG